MPGTRFLILSFQELFEADTILIPPFLICNHRPGEVNKVSRSHSGEWVALGTGLGSACSGRGNWPLQGSGRSDARGHRPRD